MNSISSVWSKDLFMLLIEEMQNKSKMRYYLYSPNWKKLTNKQYKSIVSNVLIKRNTYAAYIKTEIQRKKGMIKREENP